MTQEQMKSMEGSTITRIENTRMMFRTINQAVKYLDTKYGRSGWTNESTSEYMSIGGISTYVQYGLRLDPDNDQFSKYKRWESKYPEYNIRLS